ncbi:helix-turn-helix domain-containing protein [Clostridium senegalense]|uniref:Helix-turn-helix transcriptional regulator n=1 Tax=Clostridium senegalense TaxID=1465809 RepID=A0A6M0H3R1_9CLOT|nr:helix-turn-helix transcriptional regulator [Clostridium senegalense]NEU05386.1 helix-turn-helix transcriptional regulator [Clostridium senegalense]
MNKLSIGEVIYNLRKEKGITQDQLGTFIGVSTAAVSKWESGISYPDITILPVIATFFNISMDELFNFKIKLSDKEVMNIFKECEALFSKGNIKSAIEKSKEYVLKYPISYDLKLKIGALFNMYSWKSNDEEKSMSMIWYAIKLFEDIAKNCNDIDLIEQSLFQLGAAYSIVGEEDKAIDALEKIKKSQLDTDIVLSSIYIRKKEFKKARELLQSNLFKDINNITMICMGLANSYYNESKSKDRLKIMERYYNLSIDLKRMILPKENSILGLHIEYLNLAEVYLNFKEDKKAIKMLYEMVEDIKYNDINNMKKFSNFWCFNEMKTSERTITMNLYENIFKIFEHKEFDLIRESNDFKNIVKELQVLEEKSLKEFR